MQAPGQGLIQTMSDLIETNSPQFCSSRDIQVLNKLPNLQSESIQYQETPRQAQICNTHVSEEFITYVNCRFLPHHTPSATDQGQVSGTAKDNPNYPGILRRSRPSLQQPDTHPYR